MHNAHDTLENAVCVLDLCDLDAAIDRPMDPAEMNTEIHMKGNLDNFNQPSSWKALPKYQHARDIALSGARQMPSSKEEIKSHRFRSHDITRSLALGLGVVTRSSFPNHQSLMRFWNSGLVVNRRICFKAPFYSISNMAELTRQSKIQVILVSLPFTFWN